MFEIPQKLITYFVSVCMYVTCQLPLYLRNNLLYVIYILKGQMPRFQRPFQLKQAQ